MLPAENKVLDAWIRQQSRLWSQAEAAKCERGYRPSSRLQAPRCLAMHIELFPPQALLPFAALAQHLLAEFFPIARRSSGSVYPLQADDRRTQYRALSQILCLRL